MKTILIIILIYLTVSQDFLAEPETDLLANPNGTGSNIASCARSKIGYPYEWAKTGPNSFDCSGLALYCYGKSGISLPHKASSQSGMGQSVSNPKEGDLIFFDYGDGVKHVGICVGGGQMVHARNKDYGVLQESFTSGYWSGVKHFAKRLY